MPNITIYLNDEEYIKYLKNKEDLNKEIKGLIKEKIK